MNWQGLHLCVIVSRWHFDVLNCICHLSDQSVNLECLFVVGRGL